MSFNVDIPRSDSDVKKKKPKLTSAEIIAKLEETGIDFSPIGLGPWSHSKLKVLKKCPLKFYLQYIIKQDPETRPEISLVTETGKAAHRILELYVGGKPLDKSYSITRAEFRNTITDEQWEEGLVTLEFNIMKFKERIDAFESQNGIKRILQELRIGVTKDWTPTGFFADDVYFRGVIDLVVQMNDGGVLLVDHKLGTQSIQGMRNFNDQLNTYRVLFHAGVEATTGSQTSIHHIKEGEVSMADYMDTEDTHDSLVNRLEFSIQGAIDQVMELGYFKHIAHSGCQYCDFKPECRAKKLLEQEKATKKWFEIKRIE